MNSKMSKLLEQMDIAIADIAALSAAESIPAISPVGGCVVFTDEYERNQHVKASDCRDETGFECFINHVHLPYKGTRQSLVDNFRYLVGLRDALGNMKGQREFLLILSIVDENCTVRFHQCRYGEAWVSENLDSYGEEALLLLAC